MKKDYMIILSILLLLRLSFSLKIKTCFHLNESQEKEQTISSDLKELPTPKMIRNLNSHKCITGIKEGADLEMQFCQLGHQGQIFSYIGYKDTKNAYSFQNSFITVGVIDVPCGQEGATALRLFQQKYKKYQIFNMIDVDGKPELKQIQPQHVKGYCLSSLYMGDEGLFQVPCNSQDKNQLWEFIEPDQQFERVWVSLRPLIWKGDCMTTKLNEKEKDYQMIRKPCVDNDRFKSEFSWYFTKTAIKSRTPSHAYFVTVQTSLALNYKLEYLMPYGDWDRRYLEVNPLMAFNFWALIAHIAYQKIYNSLNYQKFIKWEIIQVSDSVISLRNVYKDLCIEFTEDGGTKLNYCDHNIKQRIVYQKGNSFPESTPVRIKNTNTSKCISVTYAEGPLSESECKDGNGFLGWRIIPTEDGAFNIKSFFAPLLLTQRHNKSKNDHYILGSSHYDLDASETRWYFISVDKGLFKLTSQYEREELSVDNNGRHILSKTGHNYVIETSSHVRPRKKPLYSICNTINGSKYSLIMNEDMSIGIEKFYEKNNRAAFNLIMNKDKSFAIVSINGLYLTASKNELSFSAKSGETNEKWTVVPYESGNLFIHVDSKKCLEFNISSSSATLGDCGIKSTKNTQIISYVLNSSSEFPKGFAAVLVMDKSRKKIFRLKFSPKTVMIDNDPLTFQTKWKFEPVNEQSYFRIISDSGLPFRDTFFSTYFVIPLGGNEYSLASSQLKNEKIQYITFNINPSVTNTLQFTNSVQTRFIFTNVDDSQSLQIGNYIIKNVASKKNIIYLGNEKGFSTHQQNLTPTFFKIIFDKEKFSYTIRTIDSYLMEPPYYPMIDADGVQDSWKYFVYNSEKFDKEWYLVSNTENTYYIVAEYEGKNKCLHHNLKLDKLVIADCNYSNNQLWEITKTNLITVDTCVDVNIVEVKTNTCVYSYGLNGKGVNYKNCVSGDPSLSWRFTMQSDSSYTIKNLIGENVNYDSKNNSIKMEYDSNPHTWRLKATGNFFEEKLDDGKSTVFYGVFKIYYKDFAFPGEYYFKKANDVAKIPTASEFVRIIDKFYDTCMVDITTQTQGIQSKEVISQNYDLSDTEKGQFQIIPVKDENSYYIISLNLNGLALTSNKEGIKTNYLDQDSSRQNDQKWYITPRGPESYQILEYKSQKCLYRKDKVFGLRECDFVGDVFGDEVFSFKVLSNIDELLQKEKKKEEEAKPKGSFDDSQKEEPPKEPQCIPG